jgi:circadian clock protein KaiC
LIDEHGLSVLPISSLGLNYPVSLDRISSGIDRLDAMLDGKGYYRGSSILISGTAGTGKTSLASAFVDNTCRAGGRCLYFSFEESPEQIIRNMRSIGFNLDQWRKKGLLKFNSVRPSLYGLEMHLASIHKMVKDFKPKAVVMDPITNMMSIGGGDEVKAMLTRVIDFLKSEGITTIFTSLTAGGNSLEQSEIGISSLMDTWLLVRVLETSGERNRLLYILKGRGMAHSNQMREFVLTNTGIKLVDVYIGPGEVLTGSARLMQEAKDQAEAIEAQGVARARQRELVQEETSLKVQADAIAARLARIEAERRIVSQSDRQRNDQAETERKELAFARKAD